MEMWSPFFWPQSASATVPRTSLRMSPGIRVIAPSTLGEGLFSQGYLSRAQPSLRSRRFASLNHGDDRRGAASLGHVDVETAQDPLPEKIAGLRVVVARDDLGSNS